MIQEYTNRNKEKLFRVSLYLGTDDMTGKEIRVKKSGFSTRREAELFEIRMIHNHNEGIKIISSKKKFEEIFDLWVDQYKHTVKENTYVTQIQVAKKHILPKFKEYYIDKIDVRLCQEVVNEWYKSYTKAANLVSVTSRIFQLAISLEERLDNPMTKIIRPKNTHKKEFESSYYTKEELKTFLDKVRQTQSFQDYVMFRLFAYTGLRKGELRGLYWSDIDLKHQTLKVERVLASGIDGEVYQTPKTRSSKRLIVLDGQTVKHLKKWHTDQLQLFFKLGYKPLDNQPIFNRPDSREAISPQHANKVLRRVIDEHDLPEITIHGFRHTHASLLFEADVPMKDVQDRLGHSSIQTTMNIYTHVTQYKKNETALKFASFLDV